MYIYWVLVNHFRPKHTPKIVQSTFSYVNIVEIGRIFNDSDAGQKDQKDPNSYNNESISNSYRSNGTSQ